MSSTSSTVSFSPKIVNTLRCSVALMKLFSLMFGSWMWMAECVHENQLIHLHTCLFHLWNGNIDDRPDSHVPYHRSYSYGVSHHLDSYCVSYHLDSYCVSYHLDLYIVSRCPDSYCVSRCPDSYCVSRCVGSYCVSRCPDSYCVSRCVRLCTPTQLSINICSCHSNSQTRESISQVHFVRDMDTTLNGGFSCLLQGRLNSQIPLVCQRNVSRRCVRSLVSLVRSLHAPHCIACSSVRELRTVSVVE